MKMKKKKPTKSTTKKKSKDITWEEQEQWVKEQEKKGNLKPVTKQEFDEAVRKMLNKT